MKLKKNIAKNIYEPLHSVYQGKQSTLKIYKQFKKAQWNKIKENKEIQSEKLFNIIKYASENIPYYKKIVKTHKITFSKSTIFEDIKQFPILTKEIIRNEFVNLHNIKPNSGWFYNTSGGSTGEPIKLIQDEYYTRTCDAIIKLQEEWTGCTFGDTTIKLWGSEKDIFREKDNVKERLKTWLKSIYTLNAYLMTEQRMIKYIELINKKKPKLILAYVHSINELANFIKQNNLSIHSPTAIITSAGVLYPSFRQNIEQTFKCPVFDRYGSREVGGIASECEIHKGLHLSTFTQYVEILNDNLATCKEGESGNIYVTTLSNYTMPLIRFGIGDVGTYTKKKCSCGRGLPLIKNINGRTSDYFITKDGKKIDGLYFNTTIWKRPWVISYQIIQKETNLIIYKIKQKQKPSASELNSIKRLVRLVMGNNCKVIFEFVKQIQPTTSGKYRYTIREFK